MTTNQRDVLFEQHVRQQLGQPGMQLIAQGDLYAIAKTSVDEDNYTVVYDTLDGHALRIPVGDRQYVLAKMRPVKKGEHAVWRRIPGTTNRVVMIASGGVTPAYSETPVEARASVSEFATPDTGKAPARRRRRGARGARRKQHA